MSKSKNDTLFLLVGAGIGLALGVSGGMLYAPSSGNKTRRLLRKRAEQGQRRLGQFRDSATELIDRGKELGKQVAKLA